MTTAGDDAPRVVEVTPEGASLWDALAGPGAWTRMRDQDERAPHGSSYLVVVAGSVPLAALRVGRDERLDVLRSYVERDDRARHPLAARLAETVGGDLLLWSEGSGARLRSAIEAAGFVLHREKVFVERALDDVQRPKTSLSFVPLEAYGEKGFIDLLYACTAGDPFEDRDASPREEQYAELVRDAGTAWSAGGWYTALDGGAPVGVVLPQPYPDDPRGTIFYIGVLPAHRGRGYGATLHAFGLACLSGRARSYVGSTDVRNEPMRRVFSRNGCRETKRQLFYRLASS